MAAIVVDQLRKTYRDGLVRRKRFEALRGVSFEVRQGEVFGLLGPNGAGKTTLIKCLLGIVYRTAGNATLLGYSAGDRRSRRRVGYLPENHRIPRHHTANTALEYYGGLSGLSAATVRQRRGTLLEKVGLAGWENTSVKKYSKGMQQRLGLAQALLHDPDVLMLDEPTDGVDPVGRAEMRTLLRSLKAEGKTIFINSHLLQEIELICDRVAILHHGQVLREATVSELTAAPAEIASFTLAAGEPAVRAALGGQVILSLTLLSGGQTVVTVRAADQMQVDRYLDSLRRANISVVELGRQRQTLEDAFLSLVKDPEPIMATVLPHPEHD